MWGDYDLIFPISDSHDGIIEYDFSRKPEIPEAAKHRENFGDFLRDCPHPDVKKYLDIRNFKAFHIEYGNLLWGDFDMTFPIMDLYHKTIEYHRPERTDRAPRASNGRSKPIPSERRKPSIRARASKTA